MRPAAQIKKELMQLPPAERAELALAAWASLECDPAFAANPGFDAEGLEMAVRRHREIESGVVSPISHEEFRRRTSGTEK